ncbi:MAG: type III pantothenate kinase, partial [Clostridia bacterium]|nr:type III pantothenate kinase [Clostridia bacterium]
LNGIERIKTDIDKDKLSLEIGKILEKYDINKSKIESTAICSVVPKTEQILAEVLKDLKLDIFYIRADIKLNFNIDIPNPDIVGADLIAGCAAGVDMGKLPCIIFDVGTAMTACVLDENRNFRTCFITPGPKLSFHTLAKNCFLLPQIDLGEKLSDFPNNTEDCMRSGVILSAAYFIDGLSDRFDEIFSKKVHTIVTGGLSSIIINQCKRETILKEELLLDGIYLLFILNSK